MWRAIIVVTGSYTGTGDSATRRLARRSRGVKQIRLNDHITRSHDGEAGSPRPIIASHAATTDNFHPGSTGSRTYAPDRQAARRVHSQKAEEPAPPFPALPFPSPNTSQARISRTRGALLPEQFPVGGVDQCVRRKNLRKGRERLSRSNQKSTMLDLVTLLLNALQRVLNNPIRQVSRLGLNPRNELACFIDRFLFGRVIRLAEFECEILD